MTARPMTEGEAGDLIDALENSAMDFVIYGRRSDHEYMMAAREGLLTALLSTSAAVRGMREALKEIAGHNGVLGATYREQAHLMRDIAIAALSGIEPGEDEQARPSGSAPISTDTKGTTK